MGRGAGGDARHMVGSKACWVQRQRACWEDRRWSAGRCRAGSLCQGLPLGADRSSVWPWESFVEVGGDRTTRGARRTGGQPTGRGAVSAVCMVNPQLGNRRWHWRERNRGRGAKSTRRGGRQWVMPPMPPSGSPHPRAGRRNGQTRLQQGCHVTTRGCGWCGAVSRGGP